MLHSQIQDGSWRIDAGGCLLLRHTPQRPFAEAVRREKTYTANRGTVKEQITWD